MRSRGAMTRALVAGAGVTLLGIGVATAGAGVFGAGPRPRVEKNDGTAVVPVGYRVTPAGSQSALGELPLVIKPFPDGRAVLVVNAGQGVQSVQVVSPRDGGVSQTIRYASPQAVFAGAAFSPDGTKAYVSAGGNNKIRVYTVAGDRLTETTSIPLPVANPEGQTINPYPAQIAVTPDGARLVVADQLADAATVITLADGTSRTVAVGHAPYGVTISRDGTRAYVTDQGAETVSVLDLTAAEPAVLSTITVGTHPNQSVLDPARNLLYVADGDSDDVSVVDTTAGRTIRTIGLAPYRGAQVGSNPDALALSPDGKTLYVANSGNNDVAVVDTARGRVRGLIPTGWYPTAVVSLGGRLLVTNAKGLGAGPDDGPGRPDPYVSPGRSPGSVIVGTLSRISLPIRQDRLAGWTRQVHADNGFHGAGRDMTPGAASSVVPRWPKQPSPIKHVIYVVRENRTFDQELGSIGKGDGDPSLNLFGDESAPNARALARRFVTIDNFYADAEVSAQGWNWVVAANSNPYSEQGWPANYSGRNHSYPSESDDPAIAPQRPDDAYIWQRLAKAGVSFRNYGFYVTRDSTGRFFAGDPVLDANTDHAFTGFALGCPDSPGSFEPRAHTCGPTDRFTEWKREFDRYVAGGGLPAVQFVRLPNDHTAGTKAGSPTPRAYVGDNDWALGKLVESVSHSKYWKSTAVFVTEDDSQNGPDHVDAHRTVALVISPYTQTGRVDSTFYSTASMLRTIELFAGLRPLTQFDAYATPMTRSFTHKPVFTPYRAIRPGTMAEVNGADAPMAAQSAEQSLGKEDQIDEQVFNQAIWKSVKGDTSVMPAPRHSLPGSVPGDQAGRHEDDD